MWLTRVAVEGCKPANISWPRTWLATGVQEGIASLDVAQQLRESAALYEGQPLAWYSMNAFSDSSAYRRDTACPRA